MKTSKLLCSMVAALMLPFSAWGADAQRMSSMQIFSNMAGMDAFNAAMAARRSNSQAGTSAEDEPEVWRGIGMLYDPDLNPVLRNEFETRIVQKDGFVEVTTIATPISPPGSPVEQVCEVRSTEPDGLRFISDCTTDGVEVRHMGESICPFFPQVGQRLMMCQGKVTTLTVPPMRATNATSAVGSFTRNNQSTLYDALGRVVGYGRTLTERMIIEP